MGAIFSPGKLMLTSEYFAMDGALVLAVPTQKGQEFFFEENETGDSIISWEAYHQNKLWLKAIISYDEWKILETNLPTSAEFILNTLKNIQKHSSLKFHGTCSYVLKTNLQFPPDYGLGSSSTLMYNLAEWAQIDPFHLNSLSLGGSGYDIAVAKEKSAVLYQGYPEIVYEKVLFKPSFKDELILIHLNQKQNSRDGISLYRSKKKSVELVEEFSALTKKILSSETLLDFSRLMSLHERKISDFLEIETVKEKYFSDAPVFFKSLGAWGGDFVLSSKFPGYDTYFRDKGFSSVFSWNDIVA